MLEKSSKHTPENAQAFTAQCANDDFAWRAGARDKLVQYGLPTPRLERWKYTNLAGFAQSNAQASPKPELAVNPVTLPWLVPHSRKLVFANGYLVFGDAKLTLSAHLLDVPYNNTPEKADDGTLWALNTALMQDGPYLKFDADATVEIIHLGQTMPDIALASPRSVINIGAQANVTIIEQFIGTGEGVVHTNAAMEINVGQGAHLHHIRIQSEVDDRIVLTNTQAHVARAGTYACSFLNMGGSTSRQEFAVTLNGDGAHGAVKGVQLAAGRQHMDTTVLLEHTAPHCSSNQTIRNVLAGNAVGVFQGKIHVHKPAQKTDGYQLCNTIMLSDRTIMNTKPELEIYADDVKCSHGTTTGAMDDAPLFYLQSRGIPEAEAKRLMLGAFIGDVFDDVAQDVREALLARAERWLDHVLITA